MDFLHNLRCLCGLEQVRLHETKSHRSLEYTSMSDPESEPGEWTAEECEYFEHNEHQDCQCENCQRYRKNLDREIESRR